MMTLILIPFYQRTNYFLLHHQLQQNKSEIHIHLIVSIKLRGTHAKLAVGGINKVDQYSPNATY